MTGDEFKEHSVLNDVLPTNFKSQDKDLDPRARNEKLTELLCVLLNKATEKEPVAIVMHSCQVRAHRC
jgi:hypothetical protein